MSLPLFLDIEITYSERNLYPHAISWSLPDGQLKYVLISPDESWDPWQNQPEGIDLQHLFEQGFSGNDVIKEMQQDLSGQTVFVDGLDEDLSALEHLFDTFGEEPGFEIATISELFHHYSLDELEDLRREQAIGAGLAMDTAQDGVLSLLLLARQLGEID
ncbi:MAG: hypothetical protein R3183_09635 [Oleiphilaceae bacterium]|nr:hypothetical protein [Oleiphilaceae bacterium]